jgi:hypothetical protein
LGSLYYNTDGCLPKDNTMLLACYLEINHVIDYTLFIKMVENISLACFDMYNRNFDKEEKKQRIQN